MLVVDPLLTTPAFGIGPGWLGPDHEVVVPATFDEDTVAGLLGATDVVLTAHTPVTAAMMDAAPRLRLVAKSGAGTDNIDVAGAAARGVHVSNVPGARSRAVAEHALFLLLHVAHHGWMRGTPQWRTTLSHQLDGRRLGVVGFGGIGTCVARLGAALGMHVLVHTRTPDPSRAPDVDVTYLDLVAVLARSDALVLCVPLTAATRGLLDAAALRSMRPTADLINVSRGPTVVTGDLLTVMASGHLHAAGLDVTDPEPLPGDHGLRRLPNVVITPHMAGRTHEAQRVAVARMRDNVERSLAGDVPADVVERRG